MMLGPLNFDASGSAYAVISAGPTPGVWNGGIGFTANGKQLVIDSNAPAGSAYAPGGLRLNANGAIYGTTVLDSSGPDVYVGGTRVSQQGQLVYAVAAPVQFNQGKGITATGAVAVSTVAPP